MVTDEEIVVSQRMEMLLNSFMWPQAKDQKQDALRAIKNDINYSGKIEEDYVETVSIQITKNDNEISFSGIFNEDEEDETFLNTNAFIFDDDNKRYYFKSHQEVVASHTPNKLGEVADLDLVLKRQ